ncbi:MAG: ATP-grasp domain-containing protein [Planctomycetota bacterium]
MANTRRPAAVRRRRALRVLVAMHEDVVPPPDAHRLGRAATWDYLMELEVVRGLRALGHDVRVLGVGDELRPVADALATHRPDLVFNIVQWFHDVIAYEAHFVAFLELCKQPYTGCNPRGLALAGDKVLAKQLLAWHRIPQPAFAVFPRGERRRRPQLPAGVTFPVIVKTADRHGSAGIAQASVVHDNRALAARVAFLHRTQRADALVERFLPGREFSVGVLGNDRLAVLPVWETWFDKLPAGHAAIATERVKWDERHQRRIGLRSGPARRLPAALRRELRALAQRTYRALRLSGYARIDFRLDGEGRPHVIEANANSDLTPGEDFPESARHAGIGYQRLLQRVVAAGLSYRPAWRQS